MTKAEAIENIKLIRFNAAITNANSFMEALDMAIEALSRSSLPSNLDEAAQKVEDYYDVGEEHGYLCCHRGDIKDAFKAGAEWMTEQGVTLEGRVCKDDYAAEAPFYYVETENSDDLPNAGDKVIVQIRKK